MRLVMRMLEADSAHANPVDRLAAALAAASGTALDELSEAGISTTDARGADHA
jgi:hypothetical protein